MSQLAFAKNSLLHLAFPHICEGCGSDNLDKEHLLCLACIASLPETNFHLHPNNPVEKIFWGRLPVTYATALFYFTSESMIQRLMHGFKYRQMKELGFYLGQYMGHRLAASNRFLQVDALVPLPLHAAKERKRGYNQAAVLCEGIASILQKPILSEVVKRRTETESQTKKGRVDRWNNMEGKFELLQPSLIEGKHLLLVDDVITTGATLEACGRVLISESNQLSIASLCFSSH
ncbi:MAG: ComF family protein [Flavisolibacter sp.]